MTRSRANGTRRSILTVRTWFYNEANASQLDRYRHGVPMDRYRHGVPIETNMSLSYAVSVARKADVEFHYGGTARLIGEVPAVMLHGALRQLSASWTRHLKALADWGKRPHATGEKRPSSPPGFRSVHRRGCLYWQVQDDSGPCPLGKLVLVTRKATCDRPALALVRVPSTIGPVAIRYHRELPADTMVRFASLRVDDLGRYWVTIQYDTAQVRQRASSGIVGVDMGVVVTAATSDGEVYDSPCLSPGQQQRKDRLQRAMARKRRLNPCRHDRFVTIAGRTRLVRGYCPPPGHTDHDCDCWKHSRRSWPPMLAPVRSIAPSAWNPSSQNMSAVTVSRRAARAGPSLPSRCAPLRLKAPLIFAL